MDVGERRIGVAVGDDDARVALPLETVNCLEASADYLTINALVAKEKVGQVIVGLPISMDGSLGPQARRIQRFVRGLRAHCPVPVATWDERLTSVEADRRLMETGRRPSRKNGIRDALAATLLLQAYLDSLWGSCE